MLKPKYGNITESVSDFHRMLDGMNRVQPVEHSSYDALDALVREEQDLERLEKTIEHVENVIAGTGLGISEADRRELGVQYGEAANKYSHSADKAERQAQMAKKRGENPALQDKYKEVARRLRRKGKEYKDKQEQIGTKLNVVAESRDIAVNSQYRSGDSALERFRVLAGLEEQVAMPRDAGIFGSTRHNQNYNEMANESLSESRTKEQQYHGQAFLAKGPESKKKDLNDNVNDPTHGGIGGYHPQDPRGFTGKAKAAHDKKQAAVDKQQDVAVRKISQDRAAKAPFKKNKLTLRRRLQGEAVSPAKKRDRVASRYGQKYGATDKATAMFGLSSVKDTKKSFNKLTKKGQDSEKSHMRHFGNAGDSLRGGSGSGNRTALDIIRRRRSEGTPVSKADKNKLRKSFGSRIGGPKGKLPG